ncbi:MAG: hemerythrin domain-containing protein [Mobilicoccus sp.]|nr:hemerythrin domain-containing protein [Mobilicoccus sp.]
MCQYCGCHEITAVGDLMDDHFEIRNLCSHIRDAAAAGRLEELVGYVRELQRRFTVHNAVEENGLYLAMTRFEEYEAQAGELYDEHDALDGWIDALLAEADAGRTTSLDVGPLLAELDLLYEHINREENGLFPAAAVILDADDWARCERLRADAQAALDRPLWSEQQR